MESMLAAALVLGLPVVLCAQESAAAKAPASTDLSGVWNKKNMPGARYGGYRGGWYGRGGHYGYGHYRGYYGGYGYYPYYGYYGGYPYYDNYSYPSYDSGSYDTYGDAADSYYGDVAPDYGYSSPAPAAGYQALYPSTTAAVQPDATAHISVKVPADALVTFNGTRTTSTGPVRQFESPPLAAGKYAYDVEARWNEGGKEVTQTRHLTVAPGAHLEVEFPEQPQTEKK